MCESKPDPNTVFVWSARLQPFSPGSHCVGVAFFGAVEVLTASMRSTLRFFILWFALLSPALGWSSEDLTFRNDPATEEPLTDVDVDALYEGCVHKETPDELCDLVISLKQANDRTVEVLRKFFSFGKMEIVVVAIGQHAITGKAELRVINAFGGWDLVVQHDSRDANSSLKIKRRF